MLTRSFDTPRGTATIRLARAEDIAALIELNKRCFPTMAEENVVWGRGQLMQHQRLFPDGQIVVELEGQIVGAVASLIVDFSNDPYRAHTYAGITDGGYFYNHNPQGDTLYGADVYVDPGIRGLRFGHELYEARRNLCKSLNLRRILAGGRLYNYEDHCKKLTPDQYLQAVISGKYKDPVLSFQLREGFVVRGLLRNYISDPRSKNFATLIEWQNPDYRPVQGDANRKVRVAAVQYQVRRIGGWEDFCEQVEYFVDTAADYRSDFVVFPEFISVQLLSQPKLRRLESVAAIRKLSEYTEDYLALFSQLAKRYGLTIIAGTHPMAKGDKLLNVCPVVFPDGRYVLQPKIHITPAEKKYWGIDGGSELSVIPTPKAKIGVLVCYDSEFPEASRYLADQGAEILFIPYCTDDRHGYARVRYCSQARAIENQLYVVMAGIIGNLPSVEAMDIHYGQAAVLTPADFEFARDGIQAQADSNVETLLVCDLDIQDLYRSRAAGSVTPRLDRRPDLFEFRPHIDPTEMLATEDAVPFDLAPDDSFAE